MTTKVVRCLNELRQQLLPSSEPTEASAFVALWKKTVNIIKNTGLKLVNTNDSLQAAAAKTVNERDIREYRWARSMLGADLVDERFHPRTVPDSQLHQKARIAWTLWGKNPYEFALWCYENQRPLPDEFLSKELIPWQMEEFVDSGMSRAQAAKLSIDLCIATSLFSPLPDPRKKMQKILADDSAEIAKMKETANREIEMEHTLQSHRLESAEMYLYSFKENNLERQVLQLTGCRDEIAINLDSHDLSGQQLLRKVRSEQNDTGSSSTPPGKGSPDLIDFTVELDSEGRPVK